MKRCFGYIRISDPKQGKGVSLEAQRDAILAFAAHHDIVIVEWFIEKRTAAKRGRPVFGEMIAALNRGKAEGVIIHKIDRSTRNYFDWAEIGDLADAGADIHFAAENLDLSSRGGRLTADIQVAIAADYIRNLRDETIKGLTGRLKQGLYPFKAPLGYLDNGGGKPKTLDPVRAPFVRIMFELYAAGRHSLRSLVNEMDRRGLRNLNGRPLSKHGIEATLNNPFYCGLIKIKRSGAVYNGIHEPLISARLFEQVQAVKAGKCGKKVTRHNHRYRGLFRCAHCNTAMIPEKQKGHVYYRCHTRGCHTTTVREEIIEDAILKCLRASRMTDEDVEQLTQQLTEWIDTQQQDDTDTTISMQLAKIQARLDKLTDALIDRLIDEETFNSRKQAALVERARLEEERREREAANLNSAMIRNFLELVKNLATTFLLADPAEKREITEIATSNRQVVGRTPYLKPANWLMKASNALAVLSGDPHHPTSRRRRLMRDENIEAFLNCVRAEETQAVMAQLSEIQQNTECEDQEESKAA